MEKTYYVVRTDRKNNELYHHGIKGQKWGIRRFQKKNGRLTAEGKERYSESEDSKKVSEIRKKHVSEMSNQELRDVNNRIQLERQYEKLTEKKSIGKKAVTAFVATATTIAAIEGAAKTYQKYGKVITRGIGKLVVK